MDLASRAGGLSGKDGYVIVKAISKKQEEKIKPFGEAFLNGIMKNSVPEDMARETWKNILLFAGYSFNRAHASSYAVITCWTAYLSAHYPAEFFAAMLNHTKDQARKEPLIMECRRRRISVLPPDINRSTSEYTPIDGTIAMGLRSVKGISGCADAIIEERENNGPFKNIDDLKDRVPAKLLNVTMRTALFKAGAFEAVDPGCRVNAGMSHLEIANAERTLLGNELTTSALDYYKAKYPMIMFDTVDMSTAMQSGGSYVTILGRLLAIRKTKTHAKQEDMCMGQITDDTNVMDFVCFPKSYANFGQFIKQGVIALVRGQISTGREKPQIVVSSITMIEGAQ